MLLGQPKPKEVLPCFQDFIAESVLVTNNAALDIRFLCYEFAWLKIDLLN